MNLLLEIILKDRGSRENAFIRRNVLSVESEGGKKKNGQNNGRLSKSANNENPCSKLYRVYIYIYISIHKCVRCTMFRNSHTRSLSPPKPKSFLYRNLLCLMTQAAHARSNARHTLIRFPLYVYVSQPWNLIYKHRLGEEEGEGGKKG